VAYIDDDAYPDPDWLKYLAAAFLHGSFVVSAARIFLLATMAGHRLRRKFTGRPIHVLLTDREQSTFQAATWRIGSPRCLKLVASMNVFGSRATMWTPAGASKVQLEARIQPGGLLWPTVGIRFRTYLKQQRGYGRAEALHREKVAREVQLGWSRLLGRKSIWQRFLHGSSAAGRYTKELGDCPFPAPLWACPGWLSSMIFMPECF